MALSLTREQILSHRRRVSALDRRLPNSAGSLSSAATAGLQDSMPRAALLSLHARVADVGPHDWSTPPLVQVWGPRYSAFAIADADVAVFTLGRLPETPKGRRRAEDIADRLEAALGGKRMDVGEAAQLVGVHKNALRYAAPTGRFLIYWDGSRRPLIWSLPAPTIDSEGARLELARRFLHVLGPADADSFASWAGVTSKMAHSTFGQLSQELITVITPIGDLSVLAADEESLRFSNGGDATRLLPSGDAYYLLQGRDREVLIPDGTRRSLLWTSRVWPGAVLHRGEVVGTWRRAQHKVTIEAWSPLSPADRAAIDEEAAGLPIPGLSRDIESIWQ